jgi:very-short-patch-repair endonuclease
MASGVVGIQRVTKSKVGESRCLRKAMTDAETILWEQLRNRKCGGNKFRRQQVIEGFIADFYCEVSQLVIEVDGGIHDDLDAKKYDAHREAVFKARGIKTLRFKNEQVLDSIESVLYAIKKACLACRKDSSLAVWEANDKREKKVRFPPPLSLQERGKGVR